MCVGSSKIFAKFKGHNIFITLGIYILYDFLFLSLERNRVRLHTISIFKEKIRCNLHYVISQWMYSFVSCRIMQL